MLTNRTRFTSYLITSLFLIVIILQGCDFGDIKPKSTTGDLPVTADETLKKLMLEEEKEFERLNKEANIELKFLPSRYVTAELINGEVRFVVTTGGLTPEEQKIADEHGIKINQHEFAVDGIAFIVNPDNPIERVTSDDLKNIFTGEYRQWDQIVSQDEQQNAQVKSIMTGQKANIKVFIQRPNSDMYSYVKDTVLAGLDYYAQATICSTSTQMLDEIRNNENAIGISNLGWLGTGNQDVLDSTVKALRISRIYPNGFKADYKEFHLGLVFNGEYPYRRVVYALTTDQGIALSTGFITFLLNKDGQKVVLKEGMVPVTQPIRTVQIN